jgi:hypothetical protein
MDTQTVPRKELRTGWSSGLARISMGLLLLEAVSGLAITLSPFHAAVQWSLLVHTVAGVVFLLPLAWYCLRHFSEYRRHPLSHIVVLGYVGLGALLVCVVSGLVVTWQGFFGIRTSSGWRMAHLVTTFIAVGTIVPHLIFSFARVWREGSRPEIAGYVMHTFGWTVVGLLVIGSVTMLYSGTGYMNEFPEDYSFLYGTNRPFAPSLAKTDTGGAFDARSLAGSRSCGTVGCHEQILDEWLPSAHRYAAMDPVFQGIQEVMAQQNGPESTRYCGGCHDPISLFSGTKNIFAENLTALHGHQEGVSCLSCHAIRETDIQGNANFTVTQPREYLWQSHEEGLGRKLRDFLIRTYPDEHNKLGKRSYKKPEYCAACHKQFIDQEVNRVGWVQLQNQYDNWAASHWNHKGDMFKTVECRECHMPLVDSRDPAAGDPHDYNRSVKDRKHRSHRFIAANQFIPELLQLEGWEEQTRLTEQWLQGKFCIPEIAHKFPEGPIVKVELIAPESVVPGETIPLRVVLASNKVGHDYPTGPLDIIQSWLEVSVRDDSGKEIFSSGKRDEKQFIEPGTFLFKAEPVDQYGNLIDRHNLWEMVGVRYRRALFPGYSDTVQFAVPCPSSVPASRRNDSAEKWSGEHEIEVPAPSERGAYNISVALQYRKVDQFLLNYLLGETNKITAPVTEITRTTARIEIRERQPRAGHE